MSVPMSFGDLQKLRVFIEYVCSNPTILNEPSLNFVKEFVEKFGGKVPEGIYKIPEGEKCPFSFEKNESSSEDIESDEKDEPEADSETDSELVLYMDGVIIDDDKILQSMGDSTKIPTEEEIEKAVEFRAQAAAAFSEKKFQEAIDLYTRAIELNPGSALFHAKRGQAYLQLKKPNACIRDCDKALQLNCDSAAAYKYRGRAYRLLGKWTEAASDLRVACNIDFDEETDEWLREVQPNAKKIEQHRIKQERKRKEKTDALLRKACKPDKKQEAQTKAQTAFEFFNEEFSAGFPSQFQDGNGKFDLNSMLESINDPEVASACQDILKNPENIEKHKSNPKFANILNLIDTMSSQREPYKGDANTPLKKDAPIFKPDFSDDGLD